jgi:hypothetical protein
MAGGIVDMYSKYIVAHAWVKEGVRETLPFDFVAAS